MTQQAIIYHDKCNDGFCSMCVAMKHFKGDKDILRIPASYYTEQDIFNALDSLKGRDILFVDFSFTPELMDKLLPHVNSVKVIDHHKTTLEAYGAYLTHSNKGFQFAQYQEKCELVLDMERSGALMTWDYFNEAPAPRMVQYISDGDLYRFKDSNTIPFLSRLSVEQYDMQRWSEILEADDSTLNRMLSEGSMLAQQFDNICASFAGNTRAIKIEIEGETYYGDLTLCSGSSAIRSRAGELIYKKNGTFAALVSTWTPEEVSVSLRADNKQVPVYNVRKIAEFFGGGGHDTASAFRTTMEKFNEHVSYIDTPKKKVKP